MSSNLLIKNVRPMGGAATDVLIADGIISKVAAGQATPAGRDGRRRARRTVAAGAGRSAHASRQEPVGSALVQERGRPAPARQDRQRAPEQAPTEHGPLHAVGAADGAVVAHGLDAYPQPRRCRYGPRHVGHRGHHADASGLSRRSSTSRSSRFRSRACCAAPARWN